MTIDGYIEFPTASGAAPRRIVRQAGVLFHDRCASVVDGRRQFLCLDTLIAFAPSPDELATAERRPLDRRQARALFGIIERKRKIQRLNGIGFAAGISCEIAEHLRAIVRGEEPEILP